MSYDFKFDARKIKDSLNCERIGSDILFIPEVDSTNNLAKKYLLDGADEGLVLVAESQTKGKGRLGRNWHSPAETGIYLSLILKPDLKPDSFSFFTLLGGVATVSTLNEFSNQRASLKWPNDIVINNKKISGLLCELIQTQGKPHGLIIGIGINANHLGEQFPSNLKKKSTSLRIVNGAPVDRLTVIQSLLMQIDLEYNTYLTQGKQPVIKKWCLNTDLFGSKLVPSKI